VTYKDQGRLDEAEAGFARARELDPRNAKALFQLADLHMRKGEHEKAAAVIRDALARKVDEHRFLLSSEKARSKPGGSRRRRRA
jgi:tetratricopeptide (TPR) repeat protein